MIQKQFYLVDEQKTWNCLLTSSGLDHETNMLRMTTINISPPHYQFNAMKKGYLKVMSTYKSWTYVKIIPFMQFPTGMGTEIFLSPITVSTTRNICSLYSYSANNFNKIWALTVILPLELDEICKHWDAKCSPRHWTEYRRCSMESGTSPST